MEIKREIHNLLFENMSAFRTDIQALRAIAVLLVLAFHVWPTRISGGYVGVDVFLPPGFSPRTS